MAAQGSGEHKEMPSAESFAKQVYALLRLGNCVCLPNTATAVLAERLEYFAQAAVRAERERIAAKLKAIADKVAQQRIMGVEVEVKHPFAAELTRVADELLYH